MRRLLLVLTVALVMVAMIGVTAVPAFADSIKCPTPKTCHGTVTSNTNDFDLTDPGNTQEQHTTRTDTPGGSTKVVTQGGTLTLDYGAHAKHCSPTSGVCHGTS